jgi:hypothetical protein
MAQMVKLLINNLLQGGMVMKHFHGFLIQVIVIFALVSGTATAQNEPLNTELLEPAFEAFRCDFVAETNQVRIGATLVGTNGLPIPISDVNLSISVTDTSAVLLPDDSTLATVNQRDPLQMIIVLDTTETVPVDEIVDKLIEELFPRLLVEDEIALITFSQEIQPRTAFYTDKNRLVNEHVLDLLTLEGDNRLYAAMRDAATDFPLDPTRRRVVLVLTDSGRRESDNTAVEEIITRAQLNHVQIFPIGFYTRDVPRPSREDLFGIANGTGGYAWFYEQPYISRSDVADTVGGFLDEFVDALNGEISIAVNVQGLEPNSNNFINFTLRADTANDATIETTIACPIERLEHSIVFADDFNDRVVRGAIDIGVIPKSDFDLNDTVVVFRLNGEIVQDTGNYIYRFDSRLFTPGYYTITAELLDRRGNILAMVPTLMRLFAQQSLNLSASGSEGAGSLRGRVELVLTAQNSSANLSEAEFTIATANNPDDVRVLGTATFQDDHTATLVINDMQAEANRLFSGIAPGTQLIIGGRVLGITTSDPIFAATDDINVTVFEAQATAIPAPMQEPITPEPAQFDERLIWLGIGLVFIIVNLLLFNAVRRARIRKLITNPDDYEISPRLMTITVYRDGVSQAYTLTKRTVFVGRGSSNDINLGADSNISRSHGVIMWRNGHWYYTNRKSRLHARINDRRRHGLIYFRLKPFTEILVGNALMVFHENAQQDVADFVKTNI